MVKRYASLLGDDIRIGMMLYAAFADPATTSPEDNMYECLAKKPDLIILDGPISSFDKNKKLAILEMLFCRNTGECLKNERVLMLTHNVEPIIDTLKSPEKGEARCASPVLKGELI